ncbi:MAG: DUF1464 family protein [Isosphaeraceae bacterium]
MPRVVGTDPGTSSLDLLLMVDGSVAGQARLTPESLRGDPQAITDVLAGWTPIDLIAGPSGYGLPLTRGEAFHDDALDLMSLVRPDERSRDLGVVGFRSTVRAFVATGLPLVFLPGLIHLPTVPAHRKVNIIDLGTPDKLAVAALALRASAVEGCDLTAATFAVVEIGSAFSAVLVVSGGQLVDASAGTRGPIGLRSGGCWDGEVACWRSPLSKDDLFRGGLRDLGPLGLPAFRESLIKHVAGLRAVTPFDRLYLSGAGFDRADIAATVTEALAPFGRLTPLPSLPSAWVKHAAQGSALLADGLAGGPNADLVTSLRLRESTGTALDWLYPPQGAPSPIV